MKNLIITILLLWSITLTGQKYDLYSSLEGNIDLFYAHGDTGTYTPTGWIQRLGGNSSRLEFYAAGTVRLRGSLSDFYVNGLVSLTVDDLLIAMGGIGIKFLGDSTDDNAVHVNVAAEISAITEKVTPIAADMILIEDSADGNNKKRVEVGNLPSSGGSGDVTKVGIPVNNQVGVWTGDGTLEGDVKLTFDNTIGLAIDGSLSISTDPIFNGQVGNRLYNDGRYLQDATFDPANVNEQLVGLTAIQTLTNKTIADYTNIVHADVLHKRIKCIEVGGISKGQPVSHSGWNDGENAVEVVLANNAVGVAIGISNNTLANGEFGEHISTGVIEDINTTAYVKGGGFAAEGDILFVDGTGVLTGDEPTIGFAQTIAFILRSHAVNGAIQVNADYPKQDALDVRVTPVGTIAATDVQGAITELDGDNTTQDVAIGLNTTKVTNATHTGEVIGTIGLSLDEICITNKTLVTALAGDHVLITDGSDTDKFKKVNVSDFLGGAGDDLGDHTATETLKMGANAIGYDDANTAVFIRSDGNVAIGELATSGDAHNFIGLVAPSLGSEITNSNVPGVYIKNTNTGSSATLNNSGYGIGGAGPRVLFGELYDDGLYGKILLATTNIGSLENRLELSKPDGLRLNDYGAGTLVSDASGYITAKSYEYGEMYISSGAAETSTTGWTDITAGTWASGELNGITFADNALTSTLGAVYSVSVGLSLSTNTANDIFQIGISINGADPTVAHYKERKFPNADVGAMAVTGIVTVTAGQTIDLMHKRISGSGNLTVKFSNVSIHKID